jgi:hypothetical protein
MMESPEGHLPVVLRVGAEGDDLTVLGAGGESGWRFQARVSDQTPLRINEEAVDKRFDGLNFVGQSPAPA